MRLSLLLCFLLAGCSNAEKAAYDAWGKKHHVKCYSGGMVIYEGETTGKIQNEDNSDGYYFQEMGTNRFVTVSGNCVIIVENK